MELWVGKPIFVGDGDERRPVDFVVRCGVRGARGSRVGKEETFSFLIYILNFY